MYSWLERTNQKQKNKKGLNKTMIIKNTGMTILRTFAIAGPLSRYEVMAPIHASKGKTKNWGNSYFKPTWSYYGHGKESSLILKGLIKVVGKRGNTIIYDLTEAGRELAMKD
jgi:hypothetical protein